MITRESIRETLLQLFEAETGEPVDSLNDDQNLAEMGLDSVDMVSLIMQLERQFKIRMSHEELVAAVTVGQLLDLVQLKIRQAAEGGDAQKIAA